VNYDDLEQLHRAYMSQRGFAYAAQGRWVTLPNGTRWRRRFGGRSRAEAQAKAARDLQAPAG
jgi:hypothetical protein